MELLPTKRMIPSLDRVLNSRVMLKPSFKSSSDTAKDMKLPYSPDRARRGVGVGTGGRIVSEGGGELVTVVMGGTGVVGSGAGGISVVTTDVGNGGVDSMGVALDGKTEVGVEGTAEEGAGVPCVGGADSGTVKMEVLMLDVDGDGVGDATGELKLVTAGVDIVGITADCDGGGRGGGGGGSGSVVMMGEGDGDMEVSVVTTGEADDVDISKLDRIGREIEVLSSVDVGEGDGEGGSDDVMIIGEDGTGG